LVATVAPLQAIIETLSGELKAAHNSKNFEREHLADAQAQAPALKGKLGHLRLPSTVRIACQATEAFP
jgi:hypothetical protein